MQRGNIMRIEENTLTAEDFYQLYTSAGWGNPSLEQIEVALENSLITFTAIVDDRVVGMARLLGDCAMSYYLKDFVLFPEYQRQGIGKAMIAHIENYIRNRSKDGWFATLEFMSVKGKEEFYKKLGFEERPTVNRGPGMHKRYE